MSSLPPHTQSRLLLDGWINSLTEVVESITDQKPKIEWRRETGTVADIGLSGEILWWEQKFQYSSKVEVWVGTPQGTWQQTGTLALQAADLDGSNADEVKRTWLEILGQWMSGLGRALGAYLGREVPRGASSENAPPATPCEWLIISLEIGGAELPSLAVALGASFVDLLTTPPGDAGNVAEPQDEHALQPASHANIGSRTLELLLDVELPVSISFGKTQLPLKDLPKLTTGSIVEIKPFH
jgi:flagellar motor switch protein FliN/FliY